MMKTKILGATILLMGSFFSCSSDEEGNNTNPVVTAAFEWQENGGSVIEADSAYFDSQYNTIKAYTTGKLVEINLTGGIAGNYIVGSSNAVSMLLNGDLYIASSGSVTVSENTAGKMSGSFTSNGIGAGLTALEGSFDEMEVR